VVWEAALAASWRGTPVWVHGDVSSGNLLIKEGQLSTVIDFGSSAVGDPACDLPIGNAFRAALRLDEPTWARGRGWALWKALITRAAHQGASSLGAPAQRVIEEVLDDHECAANRGAILSIHD
jgi:aminoglycoside phosphotransferase (APT) family kinase protein